MGPPAGMRSVVPAYPAGPAGQGPVPRRRTPLAPRPGGDGRVQLGPGDLEVLRREQLQVGLGLSARGLDVSHIR